MGDFNPGSPTDRGMQTLPRAVRTVTLASPERGVLVRSASDAATALSNFHSRIEAARGENTGLVLERLDVPIPVVVSSTPIYPGTDTGAVLTGWEDQGNSTANFSEINSFGTAAYHRNAAQINANSYLDALTRGSTTLLTSATRVNQLVLEGKFRLTKNTANNKAGVLVYGRLNIGGVDYVVGGGVRVPRDGKWHEYTAANGNPIAIVTLDPSTEVPWVSTSVDNLWDATTDEFGIRVAGKAAAEGFHNAGYRLRPYTTIENRRASHYSGDTPEEGWGERAASSALAVPAGAFDWFLLAPLNGGPDNALEVNLLVDPDAVPITDLSQVGEAREAYEVELHNQGGTIKKILDPVGIQWLPLLVDAGGIAAQSQPYCDIVSYTLAEKIGGVDLPGASGDYISAPDSARVSITGDQEHWYWIAPDTLTPGSQQTIGGKWNGASARSHRLDLTTGGELRAYWSSDGSTELSAAASSVTLASVGAAAGRGILVGWSIDVDNGASGRDIRYYYSLDEGATVTQLGSTRTSATATSVHDNAAPVELGGHTLGTAQRFTGKVYAAKSFAGLTRLDVRANPVFVADATIPATSAAKLSDSTIADEQGNTWTLNGDAAFDRYAIAQQETTDSAEDYLGISLAPLWAGSTRPDGPLVIEVRSGLGAGIGDGSLLATALVQPDDVPSPSGAVVDAVYVDGLTAHAAATQYHWRIWSAASPNAGWALGVLDTGSDKVVGTTVNEVEGASHGGQADVFVSPFGTPLARFDLPAHFVGAIGGPSNLVTDVRAAA